MEPGDESDETVAEDESAEEEWADGETDAMDEGEDEDYRAEIA
jgi:hypothetical protein